MPCGSREPPRSWTSKAGRPGVKWTWAGAWPQPARDRPAGPVATGRRRGDRDRDGPMAETRLKPPLETARDWAAKGMQAAHERIGKYARQGDALASFHLGVDVAALAAQEAWPGDGRQINVDVAPKSRVQVTAHGDIHIDYSPADLSMTFPEEPVKIAYRPGAVRSYLAAKAYIDIDVTGDRYSVTG